MKFLFLFLAATGLVNAAAEAQTGVGIGTTTPAASAALDISSSNRGVLLPRLTTAEIATIPTPEEGLLVYNKTAFQFWGYQRYDSVVAKNDTSATSYPLTASQPIVGQSLTVPIATRLSGVDLEVNNVSTIIDQQIKVELFNGAGYSGTLIGTDTVVVPVGTPVGSLTRFYFPQTVVAQASVFTIRANCLTCAQQPHHVTIGSYPSPNSTDPYPGGQMLNSSGNPFGGPPIDLRFLVHGFVSGWQALEHTAVVR